MRDISKFQMGIEEKKCSLIFVGFYYQSLETDVNLHNKITNALNHTHNINDQPHR